jgi:outer membrane protein assembly factor BamB
MRRRLSARAVLCFSLALVVCGATAAADWPRFRGPNGTGISTDKGVPLTWTDKENILWKVPLPGLGNSSPIISRGRIFLQSSTENGSARMLLCLDAASGKTLWTQKVTGKKARRINPLNSLASSTCCADGERVYCLFWDGEETALYAYTFDGKELWKHPLGEFTSQHGPGGSPVVHDGKLVYVNDQDGSSEILCLDARTGREVWKKPRRAFRACYSAPFAVPSQEGHTELIVETTAGITSFDLKDGSENWDFIWKFDGMPLRTVSSPILTQGLILATSGDGRGDRNMIAIKAGGKGDVTKTNLVWQNKRDFPYVPSLLAFGDHVYGVTDKGVAACHVVRTGREVWRERILADVIASPVLIDGKVYAVDVNGKVCVFEAAPKFNLLGESSLGEPVSATPAVADNRLYLRGQQHLFCIAKK